MEKGFTQANPLEYAHKQKIETIIIICIFLSVSVNINVLLTQCMSK